jgi:hypothetical protein
MKQIRARTYRLRLLGAAVLLALGAGLQTTAYADTGYWRLTVGRLTVISDSSSRRCTKMATQFLTFERVLRELAGLDEDSQFPPLTVYVLTDADSRRVFLTEADKHQESLRNVRIYSKYLPGRDFNVAAIVDTGSIDEPLQSVFLLYAESLLMSGPTRAFPPWYLIGVSNITNGLLIRDDGSVLLSRNGPFEFEVAKSAHTRYDLGTLLATTPQDLMSGGDLKTFSTRARDWAQYGLLTTSERRAHYRDLTALMRQGTPAELAVNEAFGASLAVVSQDFDDGRWRRKAEYKIPPAKSATELPMPEHLDTVQSNALLQVVADRVAQQPERD